jgi:hypothetical protein
MKAGMTLVLLLGAITAIAGGLFKTMHWPGANALLLAGLFVAASGFVFLMLDNARKQH